MITTLLENDLKNLDRRYRALLLNSLAGHRTAILVGTISENNIPNVAVFSSLIHFGADPALWGLVMRPEPLNRDTYRNIMRNKRYTLNYLQANWAKNVHQTSAKYSQEDSEFTACGLTAEMNEADGAPAVAEATIKVLMEYIETIPVPLNGTSIVIGRPIRIQYPNQLVSRDGFANLPAENILGCIGLDAYCSADLIGRYEYAKTGIDVREINFNNEGGG